MFLAIDRMAQRRLFDTVGYVLLEKALAFGAPRAAHQGERAADDVGRDPIPNAGVVLRQTLLGYADIDPVNAIGMGEVEVCGTSWFFACLRGHGFALYHAVALHRCSRSFGYGRI